MKFTGELIVQLESARRWDPRTGWEIGLKYLGELNQLKALEETYRSAGRRTELSPDEQGSYGVLTAWLGAEDTHPVDQPLSSRWKLIPNTLEKSIWERPRVRRLYIPDGAIPDAQMVQDLHAFRRLVEDAVSGQAPMATARGALLTAEEQEVFDILIEDLSQGVETFPVSQFVLRNVMVIPANSTIKASWENVGKIYSTDELKAAESIPDNVQFDMPDGIWLKMTPQLDDSGPDTWSITREWWHADYASRFYERAL